MIVGNPEALEAWKQAYELGGYYKAMFDEDTVIVNMVKNMEADPQTIRRWLFGANSAGFKMQANAVLIKLRDVLGENSPEWDAMRQEFAYDIVSPLFEETPNLNKFVQNYERSIVRNHSVVETLDPYRTTQIDKLYEIARVARNPYEVGFNLNFNRIVSQALFGHDISQAAMKRSIAESFIARARTMGESGKRDLIQQITGHDFDAPLIPKGTFTYNVILSDRIQDLLGPQEDPNQEPQ